jgi:peptide/nickel transport system ATP-binding protein
MSIEQMQKVRGARIGMVFQEPMTALNPVHTIGRQLTEVLLLHKKISKEQAIREGVEMLAKVGIPAPDIRMTEYPHQLSGGMRQRVVIAMALACQPTLLIADEPTTALDVTIQAQILELIKELQNDMGMSVLLITHDLGVIAETSAEVVVMYAGKVAEKGSVYDVFDRPSHPYTRGLLESIPRLDTPPKSRLTIIPGMVPGLLDMPKGCRFENRCRYRKDSCLVAPPPAETIAAGHDVACYEWRELRVNAAPGSGGDSASFKRCAIGSAVA